MKIFIPARGGSKRILRKNIIDLNGKPLIAHVIECALEITSEVYVSTDYYDIAEIARSHGANAIIRPSSLATDYTGANEVVAHFLEHVESTNQFAYVQPTSPLLTSPFLKKGLDKLSRVEYNSIISVTQNTNFFWNESREPVNFERNEKPRTQDIEKWYAENGAFYMTSRAAFEASGQLVNGTVGFVEMPRNMSFEIDTWEDLEIVELLHARSNSK